MGRPHYVGGGLAYMNLLALVERREAENPAFDKVRLLPERCLKTRFRFVSCAACSDLCPAGAIQPGRPPTMEEALCANCGACLPACPVEAFTAADEAAPLLTLVASRRWSRVELLCASHPSPDVGSTAAGAVVQLGGCLGALGTGTYLMLIALGVQGLVVRIDACKSCPIGRLENRIVAQIAQARHMLLALSRSESIELEGAECHTVQVSRRVSRVNAPALSRREFLRFGSADSRAVPSRTIAPEVQNGEKRPPLDRRRILEAVTHLATSTPSASGFTLAGFDFAYLDVSPDSCTACGACARACPTGALRFTVDDEQRSFELVFQIQACIGCQVCVHVCQPRGIKVEHAASFEQLFHSDPSRVVASGSLSRCERCGIDFAVYKGERYCSLCGYRRLHPLGAALPWVDAREPKLP